LFAFFILLGKQAKFASLTVDWPSGEPRRQIWPGLHADRY
jgi:hypothetical protein